ncbi:MAG: VWA domain-containing protein [Bacteroidetes bacterium]|nr:VWA domain-containing protein [Bacteroidota bacterium]
MAQVQLANPQVLWLLLVLPAYWAYYWYRSTAWYPQVRFSSLRALAHIRAGWRERLVHVPVVLRSMALAAIILALARPQMLLSKQTSHSEGIDIVLAIDISTSMLAQDFKPNRLGSAIAVAKDFIGGRPSDRIGLVVFAGESFTQCPITTDHKVLVEALNNLETGLIEDGTAIGMGLTTAANRLKDSRSKSRTAILLTDGENNQGTIDPKTAAEVAASLGIRVYTIGIGTQGMAPYPVPGPFGRPTIQMVKVSIDEELLTYIAELTGGQYYRATNEDKLNQIFEEIDQMEKSRIEVATFNRYRESFLPLAIIALALLVMEMVLDKWILKKLP